MELVSEFKVCGSGLASGAACAEGADGEDGRLRKR